MDKVTIVKEYNQETKETVYIASWVNGVGLINVPRGSKLEAILKDAYNAVVTEYMQKGT